MKWTLRLMPGLLFLTACQADLAEGARQASMVATSSRTDVPEVVVRRVWADFPGAMGGPSPDGKFFTFTDWETGDLAIRDLAQGVDRRLTHKNSDFSESSDYAEFSRISPDGNSVAFTWWADDHYELRLIRTDGSGERRLMKDWDGSGWIGVYDWTPDSKNILAQFSTSSGVTVANRGDLILIPVDGAEPVTVKSFPPYSGFWNASISPDGLWLVYDIRSISSSERELYLTSIGGGATELIVTIDSGGPIGWDSTSEYVWYYEVGKGGSASVSRIRVHDGRPSGTPEVVRANLWEFAPAGMARDNLFYEVTTEREFRYISSMNLDTGEITEQPLRISPPGRVPYGGAAFSPDGEKLAYAVGSPHQYWKSSIVVRSIATGLETEIPEAWWWPLRIVWSPDSRSLLVPTNDAISGTAGIFRIDLQSLGTRLIPDSERALPGAMCISADGKTVYYPEPGEDGDPKRIIAHNLSTGERSVIFESWGFGNFVVSPDGQVLAVVVSDSTAKKRDLVIQELTGSRTRRVILTVPYSVSFGRGPLVFTADGKRLRYVSTTPTPSGAERALNEIPVSGGEPTRLVQHLPSAHVVISPDGRRFSYISGQRKRELWVMESLPGAPDN